MSRGAFCDLSTLIPTEEYGRYRRHGDSSGTTPANFRRCSPSPHPDSSCSMQSSLSVPESLTTKCVLDTNGDGDCKFELCVLERLSERIGQQHAHILSAHKPKFRCTLCQEGRRQGEIDLGFDWCCLYYSIRNRIVALLEALFARIFCRGGGCIDLQSCHSSGQHWIRGEVVSISLWGGTSVRQRVFRLGLIDAQYSLLRESLQENLFKSLSSNTPQVPKEYFRNTWEILKEYLRNIFLNTPRNPRIPLRMLPLSI